MKKAFYFKRIKQPIEKPEDAKQLKTETIILLAVCIVGFLVMSCVGSIAALIFFLAAVYFAFVLYAIDRSVKRLKNLTCDACGGKLGDAAHTTYEELSQRWENSADSKRAVAKRYVTVRFACQCPNCGAEKTFTETLCSGAISATASSSKSNLIDTRVIVEDYLNGHFHV